jgi:hypothetical protein
MIFEDLITDLNLEQCWKWLPLDMKHWVVCTEGDFESYCMDNLFNIYAAVYKRVVKTIKPLKLPVQDLQTPCIEVVHYERKNYTKTFYRQLACMLVNLPAITKGYEDL